MRLLAESLLRELQLAAWRAAEWIHPLLLDDPALIALAFC